MSGTYDESVGRLCRWFENSETATQEARQAAERDRDYRDLIQWTKDEIATLAGRKQPVLTIDYCGAKVDLVLGMERQRRTDPRAFPRTPNEQGRADACTQALRFVADDCQFDQVRSDVFDNMLVEGFGGAKVVSEGDQVQIVHIPWDRLFYDPASRRADFADARYLGEVMWMDLDDALVQFPDAADVLNAAMPSRDGSGETFGDRPDGMWVDTNRKRLRIVQMWYREQGEWLCATFTRTGTVSPTVPSPHIDRFGKSSCPIKVRHAYCDRKNQRYGIVRGMISLQDEVNKRRAKALHWANSRQMVIKQGAVENVDDARDQAARPDGVIVDQWMGDGPGVVILPSSEFTAAQMSLLQHATQELQSRGPNASLAGKDGMDLSGRAILAQQQGGAAELEPLFDALKQWTRQVYEAVWMEVRRVWKGERWIRVTDDEQNVKWVGLNRPITWAQHLASLPPEGRAAEAQQAGLMPGDLQQVHHVENDIGDLDADITIEDGPNVQILDADQAALLAPLVQAGQLPAEVLIENMPIRNKGKLMQLIAEGKQAAAQQQQAQQAAAAAKVGADVEKAHAEAENKQADTENKKLDAMAKVRDFAAQDAGLVPLPGEPMPQQETVH